MIFDQLEIQMAGTYERFLQNICSPSIAAIGMKVE